MNLFRKIHDFIHRLIPAHIRKSRIFFIGLILLALPVTLLLTKQIQDTRQRASELTNSIVQDPLTGEYFDLEIKNTPTRYVPGPEGGAHGANVIFTASGNRVSNTSTLTGFVTFKEGYPEQKITFTKNQQGVFESTSAKILSFGCTDLYSSVDQNPGFYIGTFCFGRPSYVDSGFQFGTRIYSNSSSAGMFIEGFNSGDVPNYKGNGTNILVNSTVFNKNSSYYKQYGSYGKIFYVGVNPNNLSDFKNFRYTFDIPHANDDYTQCGQSPNSPQKAFRNSQSLAGYVNGTGATNSGVEAGPGGCGFTYTSTSSLVSGFVGISYSGIFQQDSKAPSPSGPAPSGPYPTATPAISPISAMKPPCGSLGDVDGDGLITSADLYIIQGISIGNPYKDWQKQNADLNGDGKVSASDIALIKSFIDGKIPTFPACSTLTPTPTPAIYQPSKTPTPSPTSCRTGVNKIQFVDSYYCGESSYKYISYWCQDGYSASQGADNGCYTATQLMEFAQKSCAGRSSCKPTPTPIVSNGYVYIVTTPAAQTIRLVSTNGNTATVVAQTASGKISQALAPGTYYVNFTYTNKNDANSKRPATTSFKIEKGKTTNVVGDFTTGKTTVTTK